MAESQDIYKYDENKLQTIKSSLSTQRLSKYDKLAGPNRPEYALELYLYNSRLSKAFLFPLHALEIILRNAIDEILEIAYGYDWPNNQEFLEILTSESRSSIEKAKERAQRDKGKHRSAHDVIAQLTFDFWSNLFRSEYEHSLWLKNMSKLLPYKQHTRKQLQLEVAKLNQFRNRIAHHEPILNKDSLSLLKAIYEIVESRDPSLLDWVKKHTTVNAVLETKPSMKGGYGPSLKTRMDKSISSVDVNDNFSVLPSVQESFIICFDDDRLISILTKTEIGSALLHYSDESGLIDLHEITISEVIEKLELVNNFKIMDEDHSIFYIKKFLQKKTTYIAVTDGINISGVIAKAHRLYR